MSRRAFTLIEVLVAFGVFALVFAVLWEFFVLSRRGEEQLAGGFGAQQDLMLASERLSRELQEGVTIFYPRPEDSVQDGVGFVTAQGRAVMFYLEAAPPPAPGAALREGGKLYRMDLVSKERKLLAGNVNYFKVKVEPPAQGKKVCLASVNLSLLRGAKDEVGKSDDLCLVTKVFLRNIKKELPE